MILLDKRALYSGLVHEQMTASRHTLQSRWYSSLYTPVSVNCHILLYNYKLYAPTYQMKSSAQRFHGLSLGLLSFALILLYTHVTFSSIPCIYILHYMHTPDHMCVLRMCVYSVHACMHACVRAHMYYILYVNYC